MLSRETKEKMWSASYLLEDPAGEVVRTLMKELEEAETKAHSLSHELIDAYPDVGMPYYPRRENAFPILD